MNIRYLAPLALAFSLGACAEVDTDEISSNSPEEIAIAQQELESIAAKSGSCTNMQILVAPWTYDDGGWYSKYPDTFFGFATGFGDCSAACRDWNRQHGGKWHENGTLNGGKKTCRIVRTKL